MSDTMTTDEYCEDDGDDESEAAPETPPKPRRGRPRATPPEFDYFMARLGDDDKSRRTIVKRFHLSRAASVLEDEERFGYIVGSDKPRMDILAELGRIENDETLMEIADCICSRKMKTKDAITAIRWYRLGQSASGNALMLAGEIIRAIDAYRYRHPDTTAHTVELALGFARNSIPSPDGSDEGST
jgi:hypothetical protein